MSSGGARGQSYLGQLGRRFLVVGLLFIIGAPTIIYWATRIEQDRRLDLTAREIARMLSVDLRYPLMVASKTDAAQHAEQALRLPDVVAVEVLDDAGGVLASASSDELLHVRRRAEARVDVFLEQQAPGLETDRGRGGTERPLGAVTVTVSKDRAHRDSRAIAWQAAVGLLILTALLALFTVLMSVRLFRPLSRLARFLETPNPIDAPLPEKRRRPGGRGPGDLCRGAGHARAFGRGSEPVAPLRRRIGDDGRGAHARTGGGA